MLGPGPHRVVGGASPDRLWLSPGLWAPPWPSLTYMASESHHRVGGSNEIGGEIGPGARAWAPQGRGGSLPGSSLAVAWPLGATMAFFNIDGL